MSKVFDDARLKIKRADEHVKDLEAKIVAFLNTVPFKLVHRGKAEPKKEEVICVKIEKQIPRDFSVIIGDAVHNLRTSLDYAVYALVSDKVSTEKDKRDIQFPFCKNKGDFDNELNNKPIRLAGGSMLNAIRNLKPYHGGNAALYGIHALDIIDKHRILIPVANVSSLTADDWSLVHPALSILKGEGVIALTSNNAGFRISPPPNREERLSYWDSFKYFEKDTAIQPVFTIAFDSEQYSGRSDVISDLLSLVSEIETALKTMEDAL